MQDFDPYRILGVARSAEPAAIKSAYRRLAQATHPDRGGDAQAFVVVVRAFGLLSDPDARRVYDETGAVDEHAVRRFRDDLAIILADMFDTAVRTATDLGLPLEAVNFVHQMATAVRTALAEARSEAHALNSTLQKLEALRSRIRRSDGNSNVFADRLGAHIGEKQEAVVSTRRRIALLDGAATELGNYHDAVELIAALGMGGGAEEPDTPETPPGGRRP